MPLERVGGEPGDDGGESPDRLAPDQLLALQLHTRGYSAEQIGRLVDQPAAGVGTLLAMAAARLGAADVPAAIREAKRRGLIT